MSTRCISRVRFKEYNYYQETLKSSRKRNFPRLITTQIEFSAISYKHIMTAEFMTYPLSHSLFFFFDKFCVYTKDRDVVNAR